MATSFPQLDTAALFATLHDMDVVAVAVDILAAAPEQADRLAAALLARARTATSSSAPVSRHPTERSRGPHKRPSRPS